MGPNSYLIFDILKTEPDWLKLPVAEWKDSQDFCKFLNYVSHVKVVNDTAERGVKLWSDYIHILTKDEIKREGLAQEVEEHSNIFVIYGI